MNEIWKDIYGFPYYQVSTLGRVRSFKWGKEKILKPKKTNNGYLQVGLCKNGKRYWKCIHRLVAEAFLENPNNLPQVNHINENKELNFVWVNDDGSIDESKSNLEYCSMEYNQNYGTHQQRSAAARLNHPILSKQVLQYSLNGELLNEFSSTMDVQRQLGFRCSHIGECCRGEYNTAYGFIWRYKNGEQE